MKMSSLLRKLLLHAMQFLGLCLLSYILMSCYIEIGHDKGWPNLTSSLKKHVFYN